MTIDQHARIYSFHTLNFIFGQIIFLNFLSKPPLSLVGHVSGTERVDFLKQDARGNLVVDSLLVFFPLYAFC
jgi:hypothetical protein